MAGDWEYSADAVTDQSKVKRLEEIIREQVSDELVQLWVMWLYERKSAM